eukprot:4404739-Prymnesium_polylepis.2
MLRASLQPEHPIRVGRRRNFDYVRLEGARLEEPLEQILRGGRTHRPVTTRCPRDAQDTA